MREITVHIPMCFCDGSVPSSHDARQWKGLAVFKKDFLKEWKVKIDYVKCSEVCDHRRREDFLEQVVVQHSCVCEYVVASLVQVASRLWTISGEGIHRTFGLASC